MDFGLPDGEARFPLLAGAAADAFRAVREDGAVIRFPALVRIDTPQEVHYYRHGGILPYVLRQLLLGREKLEAPPEVVTAPPPPAPVSTRVEEGSVQSFPASDVPSR